MSEVITPAKEWEYAGLNCKAIKTPSMGHYCGYVGVPKGHPAYGLNYIRLGDMIRIDVHGGLTYSEDGLVEMNLVTWFGFDCAHLGDYSPGINITEDYWVRAPKDEGERKEWEELRITRLRELTDEEAKKMSYREGEHFWTLEEVIEETNRMAQQFADIALIRCKHCGSERMVFQPQGKSQVKGGEEE